MKITLNLTKILIVMAVMSAMAIVASITLRAEDGPHLVINGSSRVIGVVVDGNIVAVNPQLALKAPAEYSGTTPTILIKRQQVLTEPRSWNPEPAGCPRGVRVMRYGFSGC